MRCQFLREAQVKYCRASAFSKMIVRTPTQTAGERCSSQDWTRCPIALQAREDHPSLAHCPFLHESLVQYCTAAPISKFVPYSDSQVTRCSDERHHYCDEFLTMTSPSSPRSNGRPAPAVGRRTTPEDRSYSLNHLWIQIADDGQIHIGVDGLLARSIQPPERLTFLTFHGVHRPSVVITANGVDLHLVFPNLVDITGVNAYLRSNPERLSAEPYGSGWLFEGSYRRIPGITTSPMDGLVPPEGALTWMAREERRANEFITQRLAHISQTMNDGGEPTDGWFHHLDRDSILAFYQDFLAPYPTRRTPQ